MSSPPVHSRRGVVQLSSILSTYPHDLTPAAAIAAIKLDGECLVSRPQVRVSMIPSEAAGEIAYVILASGMANRATRHSRDVLA